MKKNTMKKLLAASLSLSLALSLAACSGGSSSSGQDPGSVRRRGGPNSGERTATRSPWSGSWTTRP